MSFSLGLILLIAAVLPGIIALFAFYSSVSTVEVKVTPPPLNSMLAISMVGIASIAAHCLYGGILWIVARYPCRSGMPLADPYVFLSPAYAGPAYRTVALALLGLMWVCLIGFLIGRMLASGQWRARDNLLFGWLLPLMEKAEPDINFINAYVLSNTQNGKDVLGYEGAVLNLVLDTEKNIVGIVLRDVEPFFLRLNWDGTRRIKGGSEIATLALRASDFQNVALDVIRDERLLGK